MRNQRFQKETSNVKMSKKIKTFSTFFIIHIKNMFFCFIRLSTYHPSIHESSINYPHIHPSVHLSSSHHHPSTLLCIHPLTGHPFIHHWSTRPSINHPPIDPIISIPIHPSMNHLSLHHSSTHPSIHLSSIYQHHPSILLCIHPLTSHPFIYHHPSINHPPVHPSIQPNPICLLGRWGYTREEPPVRCQVRIVPSAEQGGARCSVTQPANVQSR